MIDEELKHALHDLHVEIDEARAEWAHLDKPVAVKELELWASRIEALEELAHKNASYTDEVECERDEYKQQAERLSDEHSDYEELRTIAELAIELLDAMDDPRRMRAHLAADLREAVRKTGKGWAHINPIGRVA